MLREITLGQYYPADSVLHRLDPRVKLMGTFIFIICTFLYNDVMTLTLLTIALPVLIIISKVPFGYMVRGLRSVIFLMLFTAILNIFLSSGEVIFKFYFLTITKEGIVTAAKMVIRLSYLVIGSSLMTLTTTPTALTDGLDKALHPLTRIKVPVHEIAMMMSIALRFIPILVEETDKIMKAQAARGASFGEGRLVDRVKAYVPVMVPLFVSAFRRAGDLAMAMEARCYRGGDGRTKLKPLIYQSRDAAGYVIIFVYFIVFLIVKIFFPVAFAV